MIETRAAGIDCPLRKKKVHKNDEQREVSEYEKASSTWNREGFDRLSIDTEEAAAGR
ncbi:MAG: hypothetical protein LUF30_04440 [Lachnospiraceae bacterium]|nr:hypothetical protein [Lachnospiraceae bacterium]